jgi:hypothetical protein
MELRYDEDFLENAVFLCASGRHPGIASLQIARFHREREKRYAILDPDERNTAFFRLHLEWFREWGLERRLTEPLAEFPLLPATLKILAFRQARGKNDDGTELYVNETGERTGMLALRPERLADNTSLGAFLRHELTHLHDMVAPAFGYRPELALPNPTPGQHRLARERYRLLWDVSIDGRLTQGGRQTVATREQRSLEFTAAFPFWTEGRQREVFDSLWTNPAPTHHALEELVCDPRQLQASPGPRPGASCPLCGFPTFAWAEAARLQEQAQAISLEFPHWTPEQGACRRCGDIYRVSGARAPVVV